MTRRDGAGQLPQDPCIPGGRRGGKASGEENQEGRHSFQPFHPMVRQKMRQVRPKEASDVPKSTARRPVLRDRALRAGGKLTALLLPAQGPAKEVSACIR